MKLHCIQTCHSDVTFYKGHIIKVACVPLKDLPRVEKGDEFIGHSSEKRFASLRSKLLTVQNQQSKGTNQETCFITDLVLGLAIYYIYRRINISVDKTKCYFTSLPWS